MFKKNCKILCKYKDYYYKSPTLASKHASFVSMTIETKPQCDSVPPCWATVLHQTPPTSNLLQRGLAFCRVHSTGLL